jgi:hypothetical protein
LRRSAPAMGVMAPQRLVAEAHVADVRDDLGDRWTGPGGSQSRANSPGRMPRPLGDFLVHLLRHYPGSRTPRIGWIGRRPR